ncbi:MAG: sugar phosphate isomerase/epimerase [Verrucomicrobiae bacterium]|nr:sugar phosphate isomerase/epimerase [Verrucomicrobiae bacterium]
MLAISTCWNSHRHTDGGSLLCEMAELGFSEVEVSHGTSVALFPGMLAALKRKAGPPARVCGVHNFCPSPVEILMDAPDAYEFTSRNEADRERAIKLTLRSIDTAVQLGGRYVVLHLGSARVRARTEALEKMALSGNLHSRRYIREKLALIEAREAASEAALKLVREALGIIVPYANDQGILLGFESRSHYEQVPNEAEMRLLLKEYSDSPSVGYWHDFGHVQRRANLGLVDHAAWLGSAADRLIGCHLHDVIWPQQDHQVPFQGSIDYDPLVKHLSPEIPLVWEMSPRRRSAHIRESLRLWQKRYGA